MLAEVVAANERLDFRLDSEQNIDYLHALRASTAPPPRTTSGGSTVIYGLLIQSQRAMWTVEWCGRELGPCGVEADQVRQCAETEYLVVGNTVKATSRLSFPRGDSRGKPIKRGDLGKGPGYQSTPRTRPTHARPSASASRTAALPAQNGHRARHNDEKP